MVFTSTFARSVVAVGLSVLVACGGAFRDAVKRGDQYAQAGMWDQAAAEYRAAQQLEPGDTDVAIKLRQVGQKQSGERLIRGKSLMARGEIEAGLTVIHEAAKLDPENIEAVRALDEAIQLALGKAEELLTTPEAPKALELTQRVLAIAPADPRARATDDRVRDTLAEQAYDQAERFQDTGKLGNALIAYAASASLRPEFRDARAQIGSVKAALQRELTFHVVLERFRAASLGELDLSLRMKPELVAQAFDDRVPLRVVAAPPAGTGANARGIHVTGALTAYRFGPVQVRSRNEQCEYIRGYDTVPNPARAEAERALSSAEQRLAQAEREVDQDQREVDRYQRDLDGVEKDQARYDSDADRARADYDRCMTSAAKSTSTSSSSTPCSSERSRVDSAQNQVQSQRSRVQSARGSLTSARERMQRAAESRSRARGEVEDHQRRMRDTPMTIQEPHRERENFAVEIRAIDATVTLQLRAASLTDGTTLLDGEAFPQSIGPIADEGWLARPATCPARGKRISLPGEEALRGELAKLLIAALREKVQTIYESYRTRFLTDARRQEAGGAPEDAVESYVRYLLTGLRNIDPADGKQISEFLRRTRGFGRIDLLGTL